MAKYKVGQTSKQCSHTHSPNPQFLFQLPALTSLDGELTWNYKPNKSLRPLNYFWSVTQHQKGDRSTLLTVSMQLDSLPRDVLIYSFPSESAELWAGLSNSWESRIKRIKRIKSHFPVTSWTGVHEGLSLRMLSEYVPGKTFHIILFCLLPFVIPLLLRAKLRP